MPELAEVEYYRRRWDPGLGAQVLSVRLQGERRIFRGVDTERLGKVLRRATLVESWAHGKWMLFHFAGPKRRQAWVGLHLGMTGELRCEPKDFKAGKHDHFVLIQKDRALVFLDPRQFGRVTFQEGAGVPEWWERLPPAISSREFTVRRVEEFLRRRRGGPIKAVLLMQDAFPGIGNWMADEVLWRARIHPSVKAGDAIGQVSRLWKELRWVTGEAVRIVGKDFSDPPKSWLFRHRWRAGGKCPRDGRALSRAMVGGRTTVWCPKCQSTTK